MNILLRKAINRYKTFAVAVTVLPPPGCLTGVIAMQLRRTQCRVVNLSASIAQNVTNETPGGFFRKCPPKPKASWIRKERRMGWGSGSGEYRVEDLTADSRRAGYDMADSTSDNPTNGPTTRTEPRRPAS